MPSTVRSPLTIMRTGKDFDNAHPNCGAIPNGHCIPAPFSGAVLQIMPWLIIMHQIRATMPSEHVAETRAWRICPGTATNSITHSSQSL